MYPVLQKVMQAGDLWWMDLSKIISETTSIELLSPSQICSYICAIFQDWHEEQNFPNLQT